MIKLFTTRFTNRIQKQLKIKSELNKLKKNRKLISEATDFAKSFFYEC